MGVDTQGPAHRGVGGGSCLSVSIRCTAFPRMLFFIFCCFKDAHCPPLPCGQSSASVFLTHLCQLLLSLLAGEPGPCVEGFFPTVN